MEFFLIENVNFPAKYSSFVGSLSVLIWRNLRLMLIECSQILMSRTLLVNKHVLSGFIASTMVNVLSKAGIMVDERKVSKIQDSRHYFVKNRIKIKRNWKDHWKWHKMLLIRSVSMVWVWFKSKEIGTRTSWNQEMLNGFSLLVNSCKGKYRNDFCIKLWLQTKNGSVMMALSAKNHGDTPVIHPRRRPNRIITFPRSWSAFGGTSSV